MRSYWNRISTYSFSSKWFMKSYSLGVLGALSSRKAGHPNLRCDVQHAPQPNLYTREKQVSPIATNELPQNQKIREWTALSIGASIQQKRFKIFGTLEQNDTHQRHNGDQSQKVIAIGYRKHTWRTSPAMCQALALPRRVHLVQNDSKEKFWTFSPILLNVFSARAFIVSAASSQVFINFQFL
jgi:hypothetical protein